MYSPRSRSVSIAFARRSAGTSVLKAFVRSFPFGSAHPADHLFPRPPPRSSHTNDGPVVLLHRPRPLILHLRHRSRTFLPTVDSRRSTSGVVGDWRNVEHCGLRATAGIADSRRAWSGRRPSNEDGRKLGMP
jgi:hypothetical protein